MPCDGEYIDISLPLDERLPVWPDSPGFRVSSRLAVQRGDIANVSELTLDVHTGTHIDAPRHVLVGGAPIDDVPLTALIGDAQIVDVGDVDAVTEEVLERQPLQASTTRLLIKTRNSRDPRFHESPFREDFVALTAGGAQWLVDHDVALVGVDYLSVQRFHDPQTTHEILLSAGVVVLEGLNLRATAPGHAELICLPLRVTGIEAAPARAVVRPCVSQEAACA